MANASALCSVFPTMPRISYSRSMVGSKWWEKAISVYAPDKRTRLLSRRGGHRQIGEVLVQEGAHLLRHVGPAQGEGDLRLQEADLYAAVEAAPLVAQSVNRHLAVLHGHLIVQWH